MIKNLITQNWISISVTLSLIVLTNDTRPSKASSSSDLLSELLVLPEPKRTGTSRRGVNARAICISEPHVLEEMKLKE